MAEFERLVSAWQVPTVDIRGTVADAIDLDVPELAEEIRLMRLEIQDLRREVAALRSELGHLSPASIRISPFSQADVLVRLS